jgi:DNA-binding MarR family transcriptional regulator
LQIQQYLPQQYARALSIVQLPVLGFEGDDLVRGGPVSVRSQHLRVTSPGADQQSRFNAWHAFLVAHAALEPILNRELEAACGLPLRWFDVLTQLRMTPHKRLSMTELASAVLLSKSGLTRLVDRIEEAGLVQRAAAPGDRRSLLIVLTPSGEKTLKRAAPIHEDGIRRHFAAYITDNEAAAVEAALGRIATAARQHDSLASQDAATQS